MSETNPSIRSLNGHTLIDQEARDMAAQNATGISKLSEDITALSTYVTPEMFGAVGDGVADDTDALKRMFASGEKTFFLFGKYRVVSNPQFILHTFKNVNGITVKTWGDSSVTFENDEYDMSYPECFIRFDGCEQISIDLNMVGNYPTYERIGDFGCTCVWLVSCKTCNVRINAKYARYVVKITQDETNTPNENINVSGECDSCGYFVSAVGCKWLNVDCFTNKVHRSIYLAGVKEANVRVSQGLANTNEPILLTTNYYGDTIAGVENTKIEVVLRYVDHASEDSDGYFITNPGCVGLDAQKYENVNLCEHSDIFVKAWLYGRGRAAVISAPHSYISGKNIVFEVYDQREYNSSNSLLLFTGDYCDQIPVTIKCPYGSSVGIYANASSANAKITVDGSKIGTIYGGDVTLHNGCVCRLNKPHSLTINGHVSFPHIDLNGVNVDCIINNEECIAVYNAQGLIENDIMVGKSSCILASYNIGHVKLYSVSDSAETLIFDGVVTPDGRQVYFQPMTGNKLKAIVAPIDGKATVLTIIV